MVDPSNYMPDPWLASANRWLTQQELPSPLSAPPRQTEVEDILNQSAMGKGKCRARLSLCWSRTNICQELISFMYELPLPSRAISTVRQLLTTSSNRSPTPNGLRKMPSRRTSAPGPRKRERGEPSRRLNAFPSTSAPSPSNRSRTRSARRPGRSSTLPSSSRGSRNTARTPWTERR
jgi:hypothetical protein